VYKILVIGPSWVGDTVLAQPLFKRLHEKHGNLKLDVLAPAWTLPLLERMPEVSEGLQPVRPGAQARPTLAARPGGKPPYDQAIMLPTRSSRR
jgi:heptosyltransferase-2